MREISMEQGNPANGLRQKYQELMAIRDVNVLHDEVLKLVVPYLGHGISAKNFMKFQRTMRHVKEDLTQMQMFLSNFILKADGDGVVHID